MRNRIFSVCMVAAVVCMSLEDVAVDLATASAAVEVGKAQARS